MEQTKKSTFKLLFYLKKNEPKKNGNAPIIHLYFNKFFMFCHYYTLF
ncbi:hypothetical protein SAMN04488084_105217 [Pedobacter antarcticus]|nr:hypothetical protein SAMN04488084_105217 [Pedobacter antarcticus]